MPIWLGNLFFEEILYGPEQVDITILDLFGYQKWVINIGEKRINHIVSNKYRNACARTAEVLASLAELFTANGEKEKAQTLLHEYCRVRYNRHRAFRREARVVVGYSEHLAGMVAEV